MNVGIMVARLIEAGCSPAIAAEVVAEVFVAGRNSAPAIIDEVAERRRAADRERQARKRAEKKASADVGGVGGCRRISADDQVSPPPHITPFPSQSSDLANRSVGREAASDDPRDRLFRDGLATIARITGRGADSCRSILGKWLALASDEAVEVLAAIEDADRNRVANPTAWISKRLAANGPQTGPPLNGYAGRAPRPGSREDRKEKLANVLQSIELNPDAARRGEGDRPPVAGLLPFRRPTGP